MLRFSMRTLTKTEVLPAADTGSEAHTQAIEPDISSDAAVAYKEISQSEELVYEKKAEVEQPQPLNPSLPQLRVIGQFHSCYILAEGEKGLYIIDQHAAQERYHYELLAMIPPMISVAPSLTLENPNSSSNWKSCVALEMPFLHCSSYSSIGCPLK